MYKQIVISFFKLGKLKIHVYLVSNSAHFISPYATSVSGGGKA